MSVTTVLNYVETAIEAITSIVACDQGIPHGGLPSDADQYPRVVITVGDFTPVHETFGAAGTVGENYAVNITAYIGPAADNDHNVVLTKAKVLPQRFRAKFTPDWKLGGACRNSNLRGPVDNLRASESGLPVYQELGQKPAMRWRLEVTENVAANAVAS